MNQSTGFTPASTTSKNEADQIADNLQAEHIAWVREVAILEAAVNAATTAFEQAAMTRTQALQRLDIARSRGEQARRESYFATQRALGQQLAARPVTAED